MVKVGQAVLQRHLVTTLEPRWRGLMVMSPPSRSQFKDTLTDLIKNVNDRIELFASVPVHKFSFSVHQGYPNYSTKGCVAAGFGSNHWSTQFD